MCKKAQARGSRQVEQQPKSTGLHEDTQPSGSINFAVGFSWEDSFLSLSRLPSQSSHLPPERIPPKVSRSTT